MAPSKVVAAKVVVLGCGFAGAAVASALDVAARRRHVEVTVVDPDGVLVRSPAMGALAAGRVNLGPGVCTPLSVLAPRARHVPGRATGVDTAARTVTVSLAGGAGEREVAYDHLVITVGGAWEDRRVPGAAAHALGFRSLGDAIELRRRVLTGLALAASCPDPEQRRRHAAVAVVGGGLAGVAAAAAAADLQAAAARAWDPGLADVARVVLTEVKPRLVAGFPRDLCDAVESSLAHAGVEVVTGDAVTEVAPDAVARRSGATVEAATIVWAAGGRGAATVDTLLDVERSGSGRVVVTPQLQVPAAEGVWAAGDAASVPYLLAGGDCPATAEFATAAGRRIARNILRVLDGNFPMAFRHQPFADVVPLAAATITRARGRVMSGLPAAVMSNPPAVVGRRITGGLRSLRRPAAPPVLPLALSEIHATEASTRSAVALVPKTSAALPRAGDVRTAP